MNPDCRAANLLSGDGWAGADLLDHEASVLFWSITEPDHRVSAFLAWIEGLPVSMVNQIALSAPSCPTDVEALDELQQRITKWLSETAEHGTVLRHLELRIRVGGWSTNAEAAILRAATVFAALEPTDRDLRGVHLVMDPFDALGPIGALLD